MVGLGKISFFSPLRKDLSPDESQGRAETQVPAEQQTTQSGRVGTGQDQADLGRTDPGIRVARDEAGMRPKIDSRSLG